MQPVSCLHVVWEEACVGGELVSFAMQSLEAAGVEFTPRGSAQEKVQGDAKKDRGNELWSSGTSKLEVNPQICFAALDWTVLLLLQSCIVLDDFPLTFSAGSQGSKRPHLLPPRPAGVSCH